MSATGVRYAVGDLTAVVGHSVVGLLRVAPADGVVTDLWSVVCGDATPMAVLGALTSRHLAELPEFALACRDGDRTVLFCRGRVGVQVERTSGPAREFSAPGVLSWSELVVDDAARMVFRSAEVAGPGVGLLPLIGGVVAADVIDWTPAAGPGTAAPEPVPAVAPAPGPAAGGGADDARPAAPLAAPPVKTLLRPLLRPASGDRDTGDRPSFDPPPYRPVVAGDHDGRTVARTGRPSPRAAWAQPAAAGMATIRCPDGHYNKPVAGTCRECALPLDPDQVPVDVDRLTLGRLWMPDGTSVVVDRPLIVIGREPRSDRPDARLVAVPGSDQISRVHAEIHTQQWTVVVVDLSENGTRLVNPNRPPVRLERDAPATILPGGEIRLADEVTLRFEVGDGRP